MFRKAEIEIVTGFLGAGKTSFINSYLGRNLSIKKDILIFQYENGRNNVDKNLIRRGDIWVKVFDNKIINKEVIIKSIMFYGPKKIIIESNGITGLKNIIFTLNNKEIKKISKITGVVTVIDSATFNIFIKNMSHLIVPNIQAADLVILNNCKNIKKENLSDIQKDIETINTHCHIVRSISSKEMDYALNSCRIIK